MKATSEARPAIFAATLCALVMMSHQVAARATRDSFFLSHFSVTRLPAVVSASAALSLLAVLLSTRAMARLSPARFVPLSFGLSALLLLGEWGLSFSSLSYAAVVVYLHTAVFSALLSSGFWSMFGERFDPRSAKKLIGRVTAAGTFGGLCGGLFAERMGAAFAVQWMLPALAGMHLICAFVVRGLRSQTPADPKTKASEPSQRADPARGKGVLSETPYLRDIAILVVAGAIGSALLDYVFKAQSSAIFHQGQELMRFFATFYAGVALVSFFVQTSLSRLCLEKLGLAKTVASLPLSTALGSIAAFAFFGLPVMGLVRGAENVVRSSLYRSAYELLYTPLPPAKKRRIKALIDVTLDRAGDAAGAAVVALVLWLAPASVDHLLLGVSALLGAFGVLIALRLHKGYVLALEKSLVSHAVEVDTALLEDSTTRQTVRATLGLHRDQLGLPKTRVFSEEPRAAPTREEEDRAQGILARSADLSSGDPVRVRAALSDLERAPKLLAPQVIGLLAQRELRADAERALAKIAPQIAGQLLDFLLDEDQPLSLRSHIPRLLEGSSQSLAGYGLFLGLSAQRFEVRVQCARSLAKRRGAATDPGLDPQSIYAIVRREVAVERSVWESQQALEQGEGQSLAENVVQERAKRSLEHVFTLLSLVLPKDPLWVAFRGLFSDNTSLRGTALEYLESVLPAEVRQGLWPFLDAEARAPAQGRTSEEILRDLMKAHASMSAELGSLLPPGERP